MHRLAAAFVVVGLFASQPPDRRSPFDVTEKSIAELGAALTARQVTSRQLTEAYLARIDAYDRQGPALRAMIATNPRALAEAEARDRERAERRVRGPLHGIPIVIKD